MPQARPAELHRHRFTLRRPDPLGPNGFTDAVTVRGALRMLSGAEALQLSTVTSVAQHVIEIRYRTDVAAAWQAYDVHSERAFNIFATGDPDDRRKRLLLFCTEIQ